MKFRNFPEVCLCIALSVIVAGCGGGSSGGGQGNPAPTGTVTGQVVTLSGIPIPNAKVTTSAATTNSAVDGTFSVAASPGDRVVVNVAASGYAEAFPVASVSAGQSTTLGVRLLDVGVSTPLNVANGGTVTVPGSTAQVTIPANGLVRKTGGTAAGTVTVEVTPINPADDINLMPGDMTAFSAGGDPEPIESFGALVIDIRDANGNRYNLATGQTATIRIPLGTLSSSPPATIPLFYFDESDGLWKEEGTATLQGAAPDQYYEGTVTHFSTWNADKRWDPVFVSGCVNDSNGNPVAGLYVTADGLDYSGFDSDFTAADGTFRLAVRLNSQASLSASAFFLQTLSNTPLTNTVTVGPYTEDITLPACLEAPFTILGSSSLLPGTAGVEYRKTLFAIGGTSPLSWSVIGGVLPDGLTLNTSTGQIAGTPTVFGDYSFTIQVQDSSAPPKTAQKSFTLRINESSTGGGDGTLTVTDAPEIVGGVFEGPLTTAPTTGPNGTATAQWVEVDYGPPQYLEILGVGFDYVNNRISSVIFSSTTNGAGAIWNCIGFVPGDCDGVTFDREAGTVTFTNFSLGRSTDPNLPPITLNGTLLFPPF